MNGHLPELLLLVLALCTLVWDLFLPARDKSLLYYTALAGMCIVTVVAANQLVHPGDAAQTPGWLSSMVSTDGLACGLKALLALAGLLVFLSFPAYLTRKLRNGQGEFLSLILFVLLATMLMASARNLLSIYLAVEFTSITSYLLAGFNKREAKSAEAGLKYFLFGSLSSGIMLYGMSLLYGFSSAFYWQDPAVKSIFGAGPGKFNAPFSVLGLDEIEMALHSAAGGAHQVLTIALALVLGGIGFKIAIAPFHMWSPDVYEGAPTPFAALLSIAPKAAGFALLLRIADIVLPLPNLHFGALLAMLAALTMTLGNLGAIAQTNWKRMLAYSSIAHAGYLLMAIAVPREALGPDAWLRDVGLQIYLLAYVLMNAGVFGLVIFMSNTFDSEEIDDVRLLARVSPAVGIAFVIFGLGLAGLPPTLGFIGKYLLLSVAMQGGLTWLAVIAILNSAVSIYFYFNIVRRMFFHDGLAASETARRTPLPRSFALLLALTAGGTLLFGLYPQPLLDCARNFLAR